MTEKVQGHREELPAYSVSELERIRGNNYADKLAGQAAERLLAGFGDSIALVDLRLHQPAGEIHQEDGRAQHDARQERARMSSVD